MGSLLLQQNTTTGRVRSQLDSKNMYVDSESLYFENIQTIVFQSFSISCP